MDAREAAAFCEMDRQFRPVLEAEIRERCEPFDVDLRGRPLHWLALTVLRLLQGTIQPLELASRKRQRRPK